MGSSFTTVIPFAIWLCAASVSFVADTFYFILNPSGGFLDIYHVLHGIRKDVVKLQNLYDNRNVLGEEEYAKFYCKINVVRICNIINNLGSDKVQLVVWYPVLAVLINDWHDSFIIINSRQDGVSRINSVQDPPLVIWHLLGIVGFYNRWVGKAIRVTF